MLKVIGIVAAVFIAGVLILALTKSDTFHIQRTISINATPDKVFPHIGDLHAWEAWSPYLKLDPAMKTRYSGAPAGIGAVYEWDGNSNAGAGRVTITDISPPTKVLIKLEMFRPLIAKNVVTFTLQANGDATEVTWAMDGRNSIFSKVMSVFVNMDRMVGSQFEEGLANLKQVIEK